MTTSLVSLTVSVADGWKETIAMAIQKVTTALLNRLVGLESSGLTAAERAIKQKMITKKLYCTQIQAPKYRLQTQSQAKETLTKQNPIFGTYKHPTNQETTEEKKTLKLQLKNQKTAATEEILQINKTINSLQPGQHEPIKPIMAAEEGRRAENRRWPLPGSSSAATICLSRR